MNVTLRPCFIAKVRKSFTFSPERLFLHQLAKKKKKNLEIGHGGWIATEEAVTDSDCAGDGRQQQSLYYRFSNQSITAA